MSNSLMFLHYFVIIVLMLYSTGLLTVGIMSLKEDKSSGWICIIFSSFMLFIVSFFLWFDFYSDILIDLWI